MSKIVSWVKSKPILYYFGAVFRLIKKEDTRKLVTGIIDNPSNVVIEKRGEKNKGTLVYVLDPVVKYSGYFAVFRRLLGGLYFADEIGATPYVIYSTDFIYAEDHLVNGTDNPFEYYFEPVRPIPKENLHELNSVIYFNHKHTRMAEKLNECKELSHLSYRVSDEYIEALAGICRKYIKLNQPTQEFVNDSITELNINDRTLAVHCRGTDFNLGSKNHPIIVTVDDYFAIIEKVLEKGCYDKIFLATDDKNSLDSFINKFGGLVCYYKDVQRSNGTEGVHFSSCDRKNHHFKLGVEVIRDAYTMAACGGLIAGMSEVSISTRIFKQGSNGHYNDLVIIDKGIVENGRYFVHM